MVLRTLNLQRLLWEFMSQGSALRKLGSLASTLEGQRSFGGWLKREKGECRCCTCSVLIQCSKNEGTCLYMHIGRGRYLFWRQSEQFEPLPPNGSWGLFLQCNSVMVKKSRSLDRLKGDWIGQEPGLLLNKLGLRHY